MKKSLIALAILGTIAGSAAAQSNVTIYGVIDASISRTDSNTTKPVWGLDSGSWSGSRIGFKGVEDLGGGLSANFQLENGFEVDNGAMSSNGTLFNRQAWVGLESKAIGAVRFGRQYNPIHLAVDAIDPFETGMAGNSENAVPQRAGADGVYRSSIPFFTGGAYRDGGDLPLQGGVRTNNAVSYTTPNFGGFSGQIVYGFGEEVGSTSTNRQIGASASYSNGPVYAVAALHTAKAPVLAGDFEQKSYFLGATYNLGVAKLHAGYQDNKVEVPADEDFRARSFLLGTSVPLGNGTIRASWVRLDDKDTDDKADQFALGYTYNLSKRTNLYTSYSYGKTEAEGERDAKATIFNVGVRHLF